jgi:hypothetical protein
MEEQVAEYNSQIASLIDGQRVLRDEAQRVSDQLNQEHRDYVLVPRDLWAAIRSWVQVIDRARTAGPHLLSPNEINSYMQAKKLMDQVKE